MSAPHEVFLALDGESISKTKWFWHGDPDDGGKGWVHEDGALRYLRADLTCGECCLRTRHVSPLPDCPNAVFRTVGWVFVGKKHPACMAFEP